MSNDLDIENLKTRMVHVEKEIEAIKGEQIEQKKLYHITTLENEKMSGAIKTIQTILEDMAKRKVRAVDIAIAIGVLLSGTVSAYAAVKMLELTNIMISTSK